MNVSLIIMACIALAAPVLAAAPVDAPQRVSNAPRHLQQALSFADARHLLQRTGFGASADELAALGGLTRQQAIAHLISDVRTQPSLSMPGWVDQLAPLYWTRGDLSLDDQQRFDRARDNELLELRRWWVNEMLQSPSPQTERLVLFWHDHFATDYRAIDRQSVAMARQNRTFRELGSGSYRTLLKAMISDPALLNFLDASSNKASSPNENLARELLELFTLGEGHYAERAVREAARALTGRGVKQERNLGFWNNRRDFDAGTKTLFGQHGQFDGDDLIDRILEQPAAAEHLVRRFWQAFVSLTPPAAEQLQPLAREFRGSDYDLLVLYRSVLESEAFWSDRHRASLIKSPADLLIGLVRTLDYPKCHWQRLPAQLAQLGMDLFAPPNVAGWQEGAAFVTAGLLLNRTRAVEELLRDCHSGDAAVAATSMPDDVTMSEMSEMSEMSGMSGMSEMSEMTAEPAADPAADAGAGRPLALRIAAEDYEGPAHYRVRLLANGTTLWQSRRETVQGGHDTRLYGRIADRLSLPWQSVEFPDAQDALKRADTLHVEFLNDAGDVDGDRNLYVDSVTAHGQRLSATLGEQQGGCVPENDFSAGDLYCAGTLSLTLPVAEKVAERSDQARGATDGFVVASVHLRYAWEDAEKGQRTMHLSLQDVQGPGVDIDRFDATFVSNDGQPIELRVHSNDCWPECFDTWPECAWQDDVNIGLRTVSFPLLPAESAGSRPATADSPADEAPPRARPGIDKAQADERWCHYNQLSPTSRRLIDAVWNSAPALLNRVETSPRVGEFAEALADWPVIMQHVAEQLPASPYARTPATLEVDPLRRTPAGVDTQIIAPPAASTSLRALTLALGPQGLDPVELLLPGLDTGLQGASPFAGSVEEKGQASGSPSAMRQRLTRWTGNPGFQLY